MYVLLGDGELNEGQIWEAAMSAAKFKLDNLVALVDLNGQQVDGDTSEVMPLIHLEEKWSSFGWDVAFVDNGHDFNLIHQSLSLTREKPMVVILKTVKGKGISFMESNKLWHSNKLDEELKKKALGEVGMNVG
ncbi:hypothetical protein [Paenibacillus pini]|nr:hypothetical protein [Paenibacillus pini]